jgi:hypothetical protein
MSIDQFTDEKTINVKDLSVDAPVIQHLPDWHVPITPRELDELVKSNEPRVLDNIVKVTLCAKILDPERKTDQDVTEADYEKIVSMLKRDKEDKNRYFGVPALSLAANTKLLFPEKDIVGDLNLIPEDALSLISDLKDIPSFLADGIIDYAVLFPNKLGELEDTGMYDLLLKNTSRQEEVDTISTYAAIRLAFPDKYQKPDPPFFKKCREVIQEKKNKREIYFLTDAAYLKILAAEKVEMTEKGLVLSMPHNELAIERKSELPEVRRF